MGRGKENGMKMGGRDQQRVRKRKKIIEGKKTEWGRKRKEEIGKWIVRNGDMERSKLLNNFKKLQSVQ